MDLVLCLWAQRWLLILVICIVTARTRRTNLRPSLLQAQHHPFGCHRVSSLRCRAKVTSTRLHSLASPATISSGVVLVPVARDLCILSWRAIRVHSTGTECRRLLVSCAKLAACRWLQGHLLLRAEQGTRRDDAGGREALQEPNEIGVPSSNDVRKNSGRMRRDLMPYLQYSRPSPPGSR